jgi:3-methyl-2-oxobutanoate hydroxymethyltransferase
MSAHAAAGPERSRVTVPALARMRDEGRPIVALTAYESSMAAVMDAAGVDLVLVGDSLGMVVQGHATTLPVTVDHIVYHCAAVARGLSSALLVADMPFGGAPTPLRAYDAGARMLAEGGAAMVKLEGGGPMLECAAFLAARDIPVCVHLGLTPQSVLQLGGFRVQGREEAVATRLRADARAAAEAGAALLVLECVPRQLAADITRDSPVPVIGIGAGADCDGQILVVHDLLGISRGRRPRFVKDFLEEGGSIEGAVRRYADAVRARRFPGPEHGFD